MHGQGEWKSGGIDRGAATHDDSGEFSSNGEIIMMVEGFSQLRRMGGWTVIDRLDCSEWWREKLVNRMVVGGFSGIDSSHGKLLKCPGGEGRSSGIFFDKNSARGGLWSMHLFHRPVAMVEVDF